MKVLEEEQIKIEKLYGYTRYLLIEMNSGYGVLDCESFSCLGNLYKIYQIDFDLYYKMKKQSEDKQEKTTAHMKPSGYFVLPVIIVISFILLIEFIGFNKFNLVLSNSSMNFIFSVSSVVFPILFRLGYSYRQKQLVNKIFMLENYHHYYIFEKFSNIKSKSWLFLIINLVIVSFLFIYIYMYTNLIVMIFVMIYVYLLSFGKNMRLSQANIMNMKNFDDKRD